MTMKNTRIGVLPSGFHLMRVTMVFVAMLAVVALTGCGIFSPDESVDGGGGGGGNEYLIPLVSDGAAGRDQVIKNLGAAYEDLNYEQYELLINTDYVFRIDPNELDIIGQGEYTAAEDLVSTFDMFSGETGLEPEVVNGKPTGEFLVVPPVQGIIIQLDAVSGWVQQLDGEFQGSYRRIYDVTMTVSYSGSERVDTITGKQVFYVIAADKTYNIDGVDRVLQVWQLRAWEDQGIDS